MEAATAWARRARSGGNQIEDGRAEDLRAFGITGDDAAAMLAADEDDAPEDGLVEVWPENWTAAQLWQRVQTQWRPDYVGLDYRAVELPMRLMKIPNKLEVLDQLRVMEIAAARVLTERRAK